MQQSEIYETPVDPRIAEYYMARLKGPRFAEMDPRMKAAIEEIAQGRSGTCEESPIPDEFSWILHKSSDVECECENLHTLSALPFFKDTKDADTKCVCAYHMRELIELTASDVKLLAPHLRLSAVNGKARGTNPGALVIRGAIRYAGQCRVRNIFKFSVSHLEWLEKNYTKDETMYTEREKFHRAFKKLEQIQPPDDTEKPDLRNLPPLEDLARPLDQLFFGGLLAHTDYQWITNYSDGQKFPHRGFSHRRGAISAVRVVPVTTWHPDVAKYWHPDPLSSEILEFTPQERAHQMIAVILHEQIHVLLETYRCRGHCLGTPAQQRFCLYLSDQEVGADGHGFALYDIVEVLKDVAPVVLGIWLPQLHN